MVKLDAKPEGGMAFDEKFFVTWPAAHFGDGERRFHAMVSRYFARS
jgi:hypothetical protein